MTLRFNRLRWFMRATRARFMKLVTMLAHLTDEPGFMPQNQLEALYEMEPGTLDDFFQGSGIVLLMASPSPPETGV